MPYVVLATRTSREQSRASPGAVPGGKQNNDKNNNDNMSDNNHMVIAVTQLIIVIHMYIYVYMYMHIYLSLSLYIYIYTHIYRHKYIYTHMRQEPRQALRATSMPDLPNIFSEFAARASEREVRAEDRPEASGPERRKYVEDAARDRGIHRRC